MTTLVVHAVIGLGAIMCAAFAYGRTGTHMARAKFITLTLLVVGSLALCYVAIWPLAMQYPLFPLRPVLGFGLTMWITAAAYSTVVVLCKRDIAPFK